MPSTAGPTSAWGSGRPTRSTTQGCCSCSENSSSKRRKQRYLDYALKRGVKSGIVDALRLQGIAASEVDAVSVVVDEHSTSIDGKYNLAESVDEELRCGMFNPTWQTSYPPVFSDWLPKIPVSYVDSSKVAMVRAADVTANWHLWPSATKRHIREPTRCYQRRRSSGFCSVGHVTICLFKSREDLGG